MVKGGGVREKRGDGEGEGVREKRGDGEGEGVREMGMGREEREEGGW